METEKDPSQAPPVEIPPAALSTEALRGIIESFILREGTDYGREEVSLEKKVEQIERQIAKGDVKIVFDPHSESVGILTLKEWKKLRSF
ncbi:MAG: YheU family protein [Pseudobdellovibrionaceae bacterium]